MGQPYLAQVQLWALNFAPRMWSFCAGQMLAVSQSTALFSLIGTTYGGNGQTTFALPDFRGRLPVGFTTGSGSPLSVYTLGQVGGTESTTLTQNQMPVHAHSATFTPSGGSAAAVQATSMTGSTNTPSAGAYLASPPPIALSPSSSKPVNTYYTGTAPAPNQLFNLGGVSGGGGSGTVAVANTGGSQPFDNRAPYLAVNFCIAVEGIFPSRN